METTLKKRIRLKHFGYRGSYRYALTLCSHNRQNLFTQPQIVSFLLEMLREASRSHQFLIWAYCFMPDHLHLLVEGKGDQSDLREFVSAYKQKTGFGFVRKTGKRLWQINFYEHVLRSEEDMASAIRYILENPVRAGITKDFLEYPFLGSFEIDIASLLPLSLTP